MSFDEEDSIDMTKSRTADHDSAKNEKKKKSLLSIFSKKGKNKRGCDGDMINQTKIVLDLGSSYLSRKSFLEAYPAASKNFPGETYFQLNESGRHVTSPRLEGLNLSISERPARNAIVHQIQDYRIFVATWNVGGKSPNNGLNLEDFLQVEGSSDIYVLGFQEIVPLNAGNVLVIEDNEPAAKWLALISQALNKPRDGDCVDPKVIKECKSSGGLFFQKPGVRGLSKSYRVDGAIVKACNCNPESAGVRRRVRKLSELLDNYVDSDDSDDEDQCVPVGHLDDRSEEGSYCLVASKQMVGIFLAVWVRSELVRHVAHLRMASVGRGIMGCLGNKGCIAMSMSFRKTSFCFICCHLTSGEKEGDELKRNADVVEILKSAQFPRICKIPGSGMPEKILDHDRVLWLGDLNYRIALSYEEARTLLEDNDWDSLLGRDQLMKEKEAGRIFEGWKEGKIHFAPTYKYTQNSDAYAGETTKSKKKRRTPAWCDRILWYGDGMEQLQYIRGESRFSDHRPVCAVFKAQVETSGGGGRCRNGYSSVISRAPLFDVLPKRHSFYEY